MQATAVVIHPACDRPLKCKIMKPKIKGGNKTAFYNSKLLKEAELRSGKPILQLKPFNIFGVFRDMRSL